VSAVPLLQNSRLFYGVLTGSSGPAACMCTLMPYYRIWAAIKREALLVAAEQVATPAQVDEIFKDVLKTPKGPFEQMDVVGLDVVHDIEEHYAETRSGMPDLPRQFLNTFIKDNKLGVKTGCGFYEYK
jgi:3-hydroxyacyl-CoA dehydrogenase